ncbi:MAG: hypothetical protein LKF87_10715 [Clostridium tyrobutyricum]|jgi:hypothetical protein|uniref:hypothetical protein n=1 Tax=Clostridium tyrobutyricum TaxID=1519 RepID=UPI00242E2B17|nr:hypothetical protein [Clostridium tyrobutyricum]MCH4201198.1 hypothetical protein [Clostridium tyrobutyricum]MCH4237768.1 hypothetical protein [Clostridium tyrobutyricum]MCH4259415.1 hypothetical protein [Clostridium tyrobutyricum]MCI1653694.1 hypothetical protein [Clostridium tyrobutyricum]MCI1937824.1 hypothetical protein [Clostridium tyrobutyricum]
MKINKIDCYTPSGKYIFYTLSGSLYILNITDKKITLRRKPKNEDFSLRRDTLEIEVLDFIKPIEVGKRAALLLEPLGKGKSTIRFTTRVLKIEEF